MEAPLPDYGTPVVSGLRNLGKELPDLTLA